MREINLFNTLTQRKEVFIPQEGNTVRFYVCGPTVYDLIHIGNARVFVLFDALRCFLEKAGFEVIMVQNFTDIDDKIINRAHQEGKSPSEIAEYYIQQYFWDAEWLKIQRASFHPKATDHISEIIALVKTLEEKGFTYRIGGDVLFDVSSFPSYGKLSRKNLDELQEGARVEVRYQKRNPADFVLWKEAKPGEPFWESPWGRGRPGWHIECSAMAMKYLGPTVDIHAGGIDLIFPHHENEIAQSEAATGRPFVRFFLHNGYVNINQEKMSKSLGNIVTIRELRNVYEPEVIRIALFLTHYRNPINIDEELLSSARQYLERIKNFLRALFFVERKMKENPKWSGEEKGEVLERLTSLEELFWQALGDDFNTPQALGVFSDFLRFSNSYLLPSRGKWNQEALQKIQNFVDLVNDVLGVIPQKGWQEQEEWIERLVLERERARQRKDWSRADALREEIRRFGYVVEDTPLGARWYREEGSEP
ncbi:MAG: cysteine--tRNA ligase [Candidatus Caldatribacteriaceae bacterium]